MLALVHLNVFFLHLKLHYYLYTFTFKTTMHKVIQNMLQV